MCDYWTAVQWQAHSQPESPDSVYTLRATRYNASGVAARVYTEIDGWHYAVLPDSSNDDDATQATFAPAVAEVYGTTPEAAALAYLERAGYTLAENPAPVVVG